MGSATLPWTPAPGRSVLGGSGAVREARVQVPTPPACSSGRASRSSVDHGGTGATPGAAMPLCPRRSPHLCHCTVILETANVPFTRERDVGAPAAWHPPVPSRRASWLLRCRRNQVGQKRAPLSPQVQEGPSQPWGTGNAPMLLASVSRAPTRPAGCASGLPPAKPGRVSSASAPGAFAVASGSGVCVPQAPFRP